jgi:DNA-binding NtrC family response regulator
VRFGAGDRRLHADSLMRLEAYRWPGNVRELENLICREYLLCDDDVIRVDVPGGNADLGSEADLTGGDLSRLTFQQAKDLAIAQFEKRYLAEVLSASRGNVTKAASMVGKERRAFGRLLKKHDIDKSAYLR